MQKLREGFTAALDNDLNTSLAITALYDALKAPVNDATKLAIVADYDRVLGLGLIDAAAKLRKQAEPEESDRASRPCSPSAPPPKRPGISPRRTASATSSRPRA